MLDVIRRDPLAGPALPSPLLAYAAALHTDHAGHADQAADPADTGTLPDSPEEVAR